MAGNLVFVNHEGNKLGTYALGLAANIEGICYDGHYFWATDSTTLYQLFQKDDGTFSIVWSKNMTAVIPDSTGLGPIETDGINLFLAYEGASGFPLLAFGYIAKVDKEGNVLVPQWGGVAPAIASSWLDMAWTGSRLVAMKNTGLASPNNFAFKIFDPDGVEVWSNTQRNNYVALAFDGVNFPCATGANRFNILDVDRKPLAVNVNLALTIAAATCIRDNHNSDFRIGSETTITAFGYN